MRIAAEDIVPLRRRFDAVLKEASSIASTWGLPRQFLNKRAKKTKAYFDEISGGVMLSNSKKQFCVAVFLPIMDIPSRQLINCFDRMKSGMTSLQVLEPSFQSNAFHLGLEIRAK